MFFPGLEIHYSRWLWQRGIWCHGTIRWPIRSKIHCKQIDLSLSCMSFVHLPKIHTSTLADPTLLPYVKLMNERRTLSSIENHHGRNKVEDPRRLVSEGGFRSYHRTASPLSDGRTRQSALSWQSHVQTNVDSPVRRLARWWAWERILLQRHLDVFLSSSAKCYHIEQKSQNPTSFDPTDYSLAYLQPRTISASNGITVRTVPS